MRVVHVYKDVYPPVVGGIEKHIHGIRTSMPDVISDVIVCSRKRRSSVAAVGTGVEVRVAEAGRVLSTPLAPGFARRLRRLAGDVFHLHMPNPLGELSALAVLGNRPIVATYHADIVRQERLMPLYRPIQRACLGRATTVIVGSRALVDSSPALAGHRDRVELVPFGVDVKHFSPDRVFEDEREALRRRLGTPLVVSVGRLVHYKGVDQLIAAADSVDATVAIAGSGPHEPRLRKLAAARPRVRLLGPIAESGLPVLLAAADVFVLPSVNRAESFGIAVLEAQAMGLPAVVTDVGTGTGEAIEPGETGLVVPAGDPRALSDAINQLLGDPARMRAMGLAARRRTVALHSRERQADRLRTIYEQAVSASGRGGQVSSPLRKGGIGTS